MSCHTTAQAYRRAIGLESDPAVRRFVILDHYARRRLPPRDGEWLAAGRVKLGEHLVDGLENAPAAFIGLLEGRNFGKPVVRVSVDT